MATVTSTLIDRNDVGRAEALDAMLADGYELIDEQVVLRFAIRLSAPRRSGYQEGRMLAYARRYRDFIRQDRLSRPSPGEFGVDPVAAKLLRALVERLVAEHRQEGTQ